MGGALLLLGEDRKILILFRIWTISSKIFSRVFGIKTEPSCNGKKSTLDLKSNRVLGEWKCIVRSVFENSPILESKKIEDHFIDCGKNHRFCASVRIKLF